MDPKLGTMADLADVLGVDVVELLSPSPSFEGRGASAARALTMG